MKEVTIDSIIDSLVFIPKTNPDMRAKCKINILTYQAANQMSLKGLETFCKTDPAWAKEEILHI